MTISILDDKFLTNALTKAWQNNLGTNLDPADGRWYTSSPPGQVTNELGLGLYGGLVDTATSELIFDESQKRYLPEEVSVNTGTIDNRNGLNPSGHVRLIYTFTDTTTVTNQHTVGIKSGAEVGVSTKATFFGFGVDVSTKFSFEFSYQYSRAKSISESATKTFEQLVNIDVPKGKVYRATLIAKVQKLEIPFKAPVHVRGWSDTWFKQNVHGDNHYSRLVSGLFKDIAKYKLLGASSSSFGSIKVDGESVGTYTLDGLVSSERTVDFVARIDDVTDVFSKTRTRNFSLSDSSALDDDARFVMDIPLSKDNIK